MSCGWFDSPGTMGAPWETLVLVLSLHPPRVNRDLRMAQPAQNYGQGQGPSGSRGMALVCSALFHLAGCSAQLTQPFEGSTHERFDLGFCVIDSYLSPLDSGRSD